jgi:hypothetical protein
MDCMDFVIRRGDPGPLLGESSADLLLDLAGRHE